MMILIKIKSQYQDFNMFVNPDLIETLTEGYDKTSFFRIGGNGYTTEESIPSLLERITEKIILPEVD